MFIAFPYVFRATVCPSSGENTVPMRHLVFVTLKQVDSLKLQDNSVPGMRLYPRRPDNRPPHI